MINALPHFFNTIRATGREPLDTIMPSMLHRFLDMGKHDGNAAGWSMFFIDGQVVASLTDLLAFS